MKLECGWGEFGTHSNPVHLMLIHMAGSMSTLRLSVQEVRSNVLPAHGLAQRAAGPVAQPAAAAQRAAPPADTAAPPKQSLEPRRNNKKAKRAQKAKVRLLACGCCATFLRAFRLLASGCAACLFHSEMAVVRAPRVLSENLMPGQRLLSMTFSSHVGGM
jgi:hypothetical protein